MLDKFFMSAIEISLWLSAVIIILKITSPLIKKTYAAKWRYIIWFILALRLIVPFNINLPSAPIKLTAPNNTITFGQTFNASDDMPEYSTSGTGDNQTVQTAPEQNPSAIVPDVRTYSVIKIATLVWLLGIGIFTLFQFITYQSFRKKMKRWSIQVTDDTIFSLFDHLCC